MYCKNCGKEIRDGAKFCPYCGTSTGKGPAEGSAPPAGAAQAGTPDKKISKKKILILVIAVVVVIIAVLLIVLIPRGHREGQEDLLPQEEVQEDQDHQEQQVQEEQQEEQEPELSDGEKIIGTWQATFDLADRIDAVIAVISQDLIQYIGTDSFKIVLCMTFNEDGTYDMEVDEVALQSTIDRYETEIRTSLEGYISDQISGSSIVQIADIFLRYIAGASVDELLDEAIEEIFDGLGVRDVIEDLVSEVEEECTVSGLYTAYDGELHLSEHLWQDPLDYEYLVIEFQDDDVMEITKSIGVITEVFGGYLDDYPITFVRH